MSTVRIQLRRGTASDWTSVNPVLAGGEAGYESDTHKIKIGDGTTAWNSLAYATVTPQQLTDAIAGVVAGEISGFASLTDLSDAIAQEVIDRNAAIATAITTVGGADFIGISEKGAANGVATLDSDGYVPDSQINPDVARLANPTFTGSVTLPRGPIADFEAATKKYVDNIAVGIKFLVEASAATTSNLSAAYSNGTNGVGATLTASANGVLSIDGYSPSIHDRIIVKNQSDNKQNGVYVVTNVGSSSSEWVLTRSSDFDNSVEPVGYGSFIFTLNGTTNGGYGYVFTSSASPVVFGTSDITFAPFNAAKTMTAGGGLTLTGSEFAVDTSVIAPLNSPTFTGTVVLPETTSIGNVTSTQIQDLFGASSAIQTQLDSKISSVDAASTYETKTHAEGTYESKSDAAATYAPLNGATFTGVISLPTTTSVGNVSSTEIGYVHGVTSAIQSQLDSKLSTSSAASNYLTISAASTEYDAYGSASTAQSNSASYTDGKIATEVTNRNSAIATAKSQAETYADSKKAEAIIAAEAYADGLAPNYDAAGSAATAQSNAETFATNADVTVLSSAHTYTDNAITNLVNGAPSTLDTLKEIADALGSDANLSTTITNHIASAKADAESYTDSAISTEVTNRNNAINTAKNQAISTSEAYTDNAISGEVSNRNTAIATSLSTAESYADTKKAESISTSESYTDSAISTEVTNRNSAIATAKSQAITTAEGYTDSAISTEVTNRNSAISSQAATTLAAAEGYTDTAKAAAISTSESYTDTAKAAAISTAESYADTKKSEAITTSEGYTDTHAAKTTGTHGVSGTIVGTSDTQTLTNKTISGSSNTITNIANSSLVHPSITLGTTAVNLGDTVTDVSVSTVETSGNMTVGGTLTISGDVVVTGNATINGSTETVNTTNLVVSDSIIYLADQNFNTDSLDIGIYGAYGSTGHTGSGHLHTGLVRDHVDGKWKFVSNGTEPSSGTMNWTGVNYDTVKAGTFEGNVTGDVTGNLTGNVTGNVSGNAGTVTNGVYTTDTGTVTSTMIADGTIVDADINASAAIAKTKISGTAVTQADTATVTNTMLAGSIANSKLSNSTITINGTAISLGGSVSGLATNASPTFTGTVTLPLTTAGYVTTTSGGVVSSVATIPNSGLTNSSTTIGTTAIALGASSTTLAGLTSVTSTGFTGALTGNVTGNADTATKLATARNINGVAFDGSAAITVKASTTNALTIGTGLSGSSFDGSGAVTIAIDSTVATLTGTQTLTNKTLTSPTIGTILNTGTLTLPTSTDTLIGKATTDTLTNKTFDTAATGNVFKINGVQISANTGTGSNVLATSPSVTGLSTDTLTTTGNVTVGGNLTVNGTTTTINSTTLNTTEQVLVISNTATPTDVTANGAGITIKGTTDKTIKWYSSTGAVTFSENIDLASGKTYKINGTTVLSPTAVGGQTIPASAIVGLTDVQTLTNKTLTSPSLTTPTVSSGTLTVSSSGVTFSDGTVQTVAGVPSITVIGTAISSSTTIATGLKDQMVPVAASVVVTLPQDSAAIYPVGSSIDFYATGTGASFAGGTGTTIINTPGLKFRAIGSVATAMKVSANTWLVFGDLSA